MWPFKKKKEKIFKITWRYCEWPSIAPSTEVLKSKDLVTAWSKIKKQERAHTIALVNWEELV